MSLRLIEIYLPLEHAQTLWNVLETQEPLSVWKDEGPERQILSRVLVPLEETQALLDALEEKLSAIEGFRALVLSVEATIPRPSEPADEEVDVTVSSEEEREKRALFGGISRQELFTSVSAATRITRVYMSLVFLSTVVASVGLLNDNVAVVIGAMVIAPLLGPNTALALATTLGDIDLARRALKVLGSGALFSLAVAAVVGLLWPVSSVSSSIAARSQISLADIALGLAAGAAGTLAFATGVSTALVGVMVAVALLPPLVTLGLLLGAGHWQMALGALLLFLTNIICINLAGVIVFLLQGMRPLSWWEEARAKRSVRIAVLLWVLLLLSLAALILFQTERAR